MTKFSFKNNKQRVGIFMSKITLYSTKNQGITGAICNFCDRIIADVIKLEFKMIENLPLKDVSDTAIQGHSLVEESVLKAKEALSSNISELPSFFTPTINLPQITNEVRATLSRLSANAAQRALLADIKQERLDEAVNVQDAVEEHKAWKDQQVNRIDYFNSLSLEA